MGGSATCVAPEAEVTHVACPEASSLSPHPWPSAVDGGVKLPPPVAVLLRPEESNSFRTERYLPPESLTSQRLSPRGGGTSCRGEHTQSGEATSVSRSSFPAPPPGGT